MSAASLPYTVLVLLAELAVGSLAMVTAFDARGQVTRGYIRAGGLLVVPLAVLALATYARLDNVEEVGGYALASRWFAPFGPAFALFAVLAVAHVVASLAGKREFALGAGAAGTAMGAIALFILAALLSPPAWSGFGMALSLIAGAAVLGGTLMAMTWGHWYLTSGRLPKEPMEQMALAVLAALLVQGLLVVIGTMAAPAEVPEGALDLSTNPAYWLRVSVGTVFPIVLVLLAWRAARIRGMMSATGLLYIALGAVLAGEVLARGLLFNTGALV